MHPRRVRTTMVAVAAVVGLIATSACSASDVIGGGSSQDEDGGSGAQAAGAAFELTTSPRRGAADVAVDSRPTATVSGGSLESVSLTAGDVEVPGRLGEQGTWTATGSLEPGTTYTMATVATTAGGETERSRSRFTTRDLTLDEQTYASVAPLQGETVGVGMPVVVSFDIPVTDKASIEDHLSVESSPEQEGSWHWVSDTEVRWRPREYWQPGTEVTVDADVNSVPAGDGIYGQESRRIDFTVGSSVIHRVDVGTHRMKTFVDGELARTMPISAGKGGFETRSGVKVIMEKHRTKTMDAATTGIQPGDPEYYNIDDVEYALRVTNSGEFLHAAPWSVGSQGSANVSHGCVGMSTEDAAWVYETSKRGDVVEVTGTSRSMETDNGWGDWNESFGDYSEASALG